MRGSLFARCAISLFAVFATACYEGGELEDKEPPPGYPGGFCQAPDASCNPGLTCLDDSICYDPTEPCKGVFCGGNGGCFLDGESFEPFCMCDPGFTNEDFSHFCVPES